MAALINEAYLRATFDIHDEVDDARLTPYIAAASRRLKGWVGETNYADEELADELKLAEANLAMSLLLPNLNTAIRPNGLVKRETIENNVVVDYFSPADIEKVAAAYLEHAASIAKTWDQEDGFAGPSVIEVADGTSCEAATRPCC